MAEETRRSEPEAPANDTADDQRQDWIEPEIEELAVNASAGAALGIFDTAGYS